MIKTNFVKMKINFYVNYVDDCVMLYLKVANVNFYVNLKHNYTTLLKTDA